MVVVYAQGLAGVVYICVYGEICAVWKTQAPLFTYREFAQYDISKKFAVAGLEKVVMAVGVLPKDGVGLPVVFCKELLQAYYVRVVLFQVVRNSVLPSQEPWQ